MHVVGSGNDLKPGWKVTFQIIWKSLSVKGSQVSTIHEVDFEISASFRLLPTKLLRITSFAKVVKHYELSDSFS